MPIDQNEVDSQWAAFMSDPRYRGASRETQKKLSDRFYRAIGTPSQIQGSSFAPKPEKAPFLRGIASEALGTVVKFPETVARLGISAQEAAGIISQPLAEQSKEYVSDLAEGFRRLPLNEGETTTGAQQVIGGIAGSIPLAGGLGGALRGATVAGKALVPRAMASTLGRSPIAADVATGAGYGLLTGEAPGTTAAEFAGGGLLARGIGRAISPLLKRTPKIETSPEVQAVIEDALPPQLMSSGEVVARAQARIEGQAIPPQKAEVSVAQDAPEIQLLKALPGYSEKRRLALPEVGGTSAKFEMPGEAPRNFGGPRPPMPQPQGRVIEPIQEAEVLGSRPLPKPGIPQPETGGRMSKLPAGPPTGDRIAPLRNLRLLRDEARKLGYGDEVNEMAPGNLWAVVESKIKPEEASILHGPEKPFVSRSVSPPTTTGKLDYDPFSGGYVVSAPKAKGRPGVTGAVIDGGSRARVEKSAALREMLEDQKAIMEANEIMRSPIERDMQFWRDQGMTEVATYVSEGKKLFSEKLRSPTLSRQSTSVPKVFKGAGKSGVEFLERGQQANTVRNQITERMVSGTGLRKTLAPIKDWGTFVDAYQKGAPAGSPAMETAIPTMRSAMKGMDDLLQNAAMLTERGGKQIPYETLQNFLPGMIDKKAVKRLSKDERHWIKLSQKYPQIAKTPEEAKKLLEGMMREDSKYGLLNADVISRKINPQGAEMYRDWGFELNMGLAAPIYIRSMAKRAAMLRSFGGVEPEQAAQLFQAAKGGDAEALKALVARADLPLHDSLLTQMITEGAHPGIVRPASDSLLGRSALSDGEKLIVKINSTFQLGKLGFSALPNASEVSMLAEKFGWKPVMSNMAALSKRVLQRRGRDYNPEAWDAATVTYVNDLSDLVVNSPERLTSWYLKWTGNTPVEIALRTVGLSLSKPYITRQALRAVAGDGGAMKELVDLGVNLKTLKEAGGVMSKFDLDRASRMLVENLVPVSRPDKLPSGWRQSLGGNLWSVFQSWTFQHSQRLHAKWKESPLAAARMMAFLAPTAYTALYLRSKVASIGTERYEKVKFVPDDWTDTAFNMNLMTSLFGIYGLGFTFFHPQGEYEARRNVVGASGSTFFSIVNAGIGIGAAAHADDQRVRRMFYPLLNAIRRETSGIPVVKIATHRAAAAVKPIEGGGGLGSIGTLGGLGGGP